MIIGGMAAIVHGVPRLALHGQRMDIDRVRRLVREIGAALDDSTRAEEFEALLDRV